MANHKKQPKAKEPVRIRFKQLSDGSQSIYLDTYYNGKRSYEFLKLYLIPENTSRAKAQNAAIMDAANAIKSKRIIELANNKAGLKKSKPKTRITLHDWLQRYYDDHERKGARGNKVILNTQHILDCYNRKALLSDVDKDFCLGFIDFMRNTYIGQHGQRLATYTCISYLGCLRGALNKAVSEDLIPLNPISRLTINEKFKAPESKREYLTIEELKRMIAAPCSREDVKRAYLFSCYCGLRISDVRKLRWGDIIRDGEQCRIAIVMKKTQAPLYIPLSKQSLLYLPERTNQADEDLIFPTLPSAKGGCSPALKQWAKNAGITKNITYHTSRHTFATMMITLDANLYVVSKLLGHSNLKTTEIYAKIVNKKKDDAIALIDREFADTH
ncbi:MAG: site-specific integrase [Prevotella sp.]|nr:site-specific integrase [Prevotella sp.]